MNEKEIWKDVPNYEGYYQVSNLGRIKAINRVVNIKETKTMCLREHIMKQRKTNKGYMVVRLSKDGIAKNMFVHVAVLTSFSKRPQGMSQINHKDEDKANNNLTNLEFCTPSYNQNYGRCSKNKSDATINDKRKSKAIIQISLDGSEINCFPSLREVERILGFQHGHIREACNGKLHTAYGYKWRWK